MTNEATESAELTLTEDDTRSSLWLRLRAHYENELKRLRRKNDGNLGAEETAKLRGRIASVRELLALDPGTGEQ